MFLQIKKYLLLVVAAITFLGTSAKVYENYSVEESLAFFYNGDYRSCIIYGYDYIFESPHKADHGEIIMLMAVNAYQKLYEEVQLQVFNFGFDKANRDKINALNDDLGYYAQVVDKIAFFIEDVYKDRFNNRADLHTYYYWKQYQIDYLNIMMVITGDKKDEKALKSALNDFHKYVVPKAEDKVFSVSERLNIMRTELLYLNSHEVKTSQTIDFVRNKMFPAYIAYFQATDTDPLTASLNFNSLKACVSTINSNLNDDNNNGKIKVADIDAACDLNIMIKTMEQYINGARAYKSLLDKGWRDIQRQLPPDGVAHELVVTSGSSDSWMFSFSFDDSSQHPEYKYMGHSYMTEVDLFGFNQEAAKGKMAGKNHIYFSCPEEIAFFSPEVHTGAYRLHTLAELCRERRISPAHGGLVSMADISYSQYDKASSDTAISKGTVNTSKLNGSARELKFLQQTFGNKLATFDGHNATRSAFLQIVKQPISILHISTHGYYDSKADKSQTMDDIGSAMTGEITLRNCGLKLSDYNDHTPEGRITAYEISQLDLSNIELVFLDACQTSEGKVVNGVPHSLAEAFHRAGVQNIIATTDEVRDDDATQFCITFFKNIANGMTYHDAFYATPQPWRYKKNDNESSRPRTDNAVKKQTGGMFVLWE